MNPSPTSTARWGPLHTSASLPVSLRIARRVRAEALDSVPPLASEDPHFTLGVATTPEDMLPAEMFPGLAFVRRAQMKFDGPGGVSSIDLAEVRGVASDVPSDSSSGRAAAVSFMNYVEGHFQIPEYIPTTLLRVSQCGQKWRLSMNMRCIATSRGLRMISQHRRLPPLLTGR